MPSAAPPAPCRAGNSTCRGSRRRSGCAGARRARRGAPNCADPAVAHDGDPVGERQRLLLVVRDVDEGDGRARCCDALDLALQLGRAASCRAPRAARPAAARGLEDQRARQRHALLLAAGKLCGQRSRKAASCTSSSVSPHLAVALGAARPRNSQREGDVLGHRHVREQRIALEHHAEVALLRRQGGDVAAVQQHGARAGRDEAGDHHQDGGLAAAGRAKQRQEHAPIDRSETASTAVKLP